MAPATRMSELIAFLLPPATALAGMRLAQWLLGNKFDTLFGFGFRFALGLSFGMLVFSQAALFGAMVGINLAALLAYLILLWGVVEVVLLAVKFPALRQLIKFQPGHLWLLLLIPLLYSWWVFGRLSTLEGTLEFDANAFWVFKSKILFLDQGKNLIDILHQGDLGYAHMDYPMLVPCLYLLDYGAVGHVDEFVNKVWPLWMIIALCSAVLSLARVWRNPRPLPIAVVTLLAFLPASLEFIRNEGGTVPMVYSTSLAMLLIVSAIYQENELAPAALILALAGAFATKFEGAVFAAICCLLLLPFFLRRGWFKNPTLWKCAAAAAFCQVPYLLYRHAKPVLHYQSAWLHEGMAAPHTVIHRFPQVWFLEFVARFFKPEFFHWQANGESLQWAGRWTGWDSLLNNQLSLLPWLLLILLVITLAFKSKGRIPVVVLSGAVILVFSFLSLVVSCLYYNSLSTSIDFACNPDTVGRYAYPFFTAWFLGITALWFMDEKNQPQPVPAPEQKSPSLAPQKPKRRR
jgi:hypothetical protein